MSPRGKNTKKRSFLVWGAGIGISLIAAWTIFTVRWPERNAANSADGKYVIKPEKTVRLNDQSQSTAENTSRVEKTTKSSSSRRDPASAQPDQPTKIGSLIANHTRTHAELAEKLSQIALDANASEQERLEALEHGKNLGFSQMLPLSSDPNLPVLLADSYLNGLHQHDQPKEQVSGAIGLLSHSDHEIRNQAQILIGFLIGAEECVDLADESIAIERLREKADAFLNQSDEVEEEVSGQ
jgi:hypothetical protein